MATSTSLDRLSSGTSFEESFHTQKKRQLEVRELATNRTLDRRLNQIGRTGDSIGQGASNRNFEKWPEEAFFDSENVL